MEYGSAGEWTGLVPSENTRKIRADTYRQTYSGCLRHRHVFVFLIGCSYRGSGWALTSPTWLPPLATGGERGNSVR